MVITLKQHAWRFYERHLILGKLITLYDWLMITVWILWIGEFDKMPLIELVNRYSQENNVVNATLWKEETIKKHLYTYVHDQRKYFALLKSLLFI